MTDEEDDKDEIIDKVRVTSVGQVTIPKKMREKCGIQTNKEIAISTFGSVVVLYRDKNSRVMSYSFLYNKILSLKLELDSLFSKYSEQQRHLLYQDTVVEELRKKVGDK